MLALKTIFHTLRMHAPKNPLSLTGYVNSILHKSIFKNHIVDIDVSNFAFCEEKRETLMLIFILLIWIYIYQKNSFNCYNNVPHAKELLLLIYVNASIKAIAND